MIPIPGYNGRYSATEDGQIYSNLHNVYLKQFVRRGGYKEVKIAKEPNKFKSTLVHQLICLAFHGLPPEGKTEVNHIDFNPSNNSADNLEWCSGDENRKHTINHNRAWPRFSQKIPIYSVNSDGIKTFYSSFREARDKDGFNPGGISLCVRGKKKTYKGLQWFLTEEKGEL